MMVVLRHSNANRGSGAAMTMTMVMVIAMTAERETAPHPLSLLGGAPTQFASRTRVVSSDATTINHPGTAEHDDDVSTMVVTIQTYFV